MYIAFVRKGAKFDAAAKGEYADIQGEFIYIKCTSYSYKQIAILKGRARTRDELQLLYMSEKHWRETIASDVTLIG